MIQPMRLPRATPMTIISGMTIYALTPAFSITAEAALTRAITPPTERSIPPVRITSVIPIATSSRLESFMKRLKKTCGFCMVGYNLPPTKNTVRNTPKVKSTPPFCIKKRLIRCFMLGSSSFRGKSIDKPAHVIGIEQDYNEDKHGFCCQQRIGRHAQVIDCNCKGPYYHCADRAGQQVEPPTGHQRTTHDNRQDGIQLVIQAVVISVRTVHV